VLSGRWAERLLLRLSRPAASEDFREGQPHHTLDSAIRYLEGQYPGIANLVRDRTVLDFGCGSGHHATALARAGARFVVGVDINAKLLDAARSLARESGVGDRTEFAERLPPARIGTFDIVMSHNSMEHFPDPEAVLTEMLEAARPGGQVLIGFSLPWYSPYGSHMHFFTRVPWVSLWFSEATVMGVRAKFRHDGATRYEDVEGGLNRMSLSKFERLTRSSGLRPISLHDVGVKGLHFLTRIPVVRELITNEIVAQFERPGAPSPGRPA
jgi:SAM-dependent methyltransferase